MQSLIDQAREDRSVSNAVLNELQIARPNTIRFHLIILDSKVATRARQHSQARGGSVAA
jgi:hypothetical protein